MNEQVTARYLKRKFANDPRMQELIDYINRAVFYLYQEYRNTGTSTDAELVWKRNIVDLSVKMVAALGHGHELHGNLSTILGNYGNITRAYRETILGSYATDMPGNPEEWEIDDRLLEIGKGTDPENRDFALRIYKSGLTMLSNALLIGAFETGEMEPVDGMIQYKATEGALIRHLGEWINLIGKSAYEIAVSYGFTGTEAEWLASLKGAKGDTGAAGDDGVDGREIEMSVQGGWLCERYVGDTIWIQLYQVPTADTSVIVRIDFQSLDAFTYTCPAALKFTSMESENTAPSLSVALNTNMAKYADLIITPTSLGLIILTGEQL